MFIQRKIAQRQKEEIHLSLMQFIPYVAVRQIMRKVRKKLHT